MADKQGSLGPPGHRVPTPAPPANSSGGSGSRSESNKRPAPPDDGDAVLINHFNYACYVYVKVSCKGTNVITESMLARVFHQPNFVCNWLGFIKIDKRSDSCKNLVIFSRKDKDRLNQLFLVTEGYMYLDQKILIKFRFVNVDRLNYLVNTGNYRQISVKFWSKLGEHVVPKKEGNEKNDCFTVDLGVANKKKQKTTQSGRASSPILIDDDDDDEDDDNVVVTINDTVCNGTRNKKRTNGPINHLAKSSSSSQAPPESSSPPRLVIDDERLVGGDE